MLQLLNHLNITATRFADEIGVQRSGISHILSGRNQPSYEFILKTANRYPEISLEWLLTGTGSIKKDTNQLESRKEGQYRHDSRNKIKSEANEEQLKLNLNETENTQKESRVTYVNSITQVIVLYANGTFKAYEADGKD